MLIRLARACLLLLSAALLVLPYHFSALWPLACVAFVPFFFAIDRLSGSEAFRYGLAHGCVYFAALGYWISYVNVLGFVVLAAYLACYHAVFAVASVKHMNPSAAVFQVLLRRHCGSMLTVCSAWVLLEALRGWLIGGLPWALLGYTQWGNPVAIQIADLTGAYGVSAYVMAVNVLLFKLLKTLVGKDRALESCAGAAARWRQALVLGALLAAISAAVLGYGISRLVRYDAVARLAERSPERALRIAVLQGNIPQDQKWDARIKSIIFEKYKRLTFMAALEKVRLIVWPETSFPGYLEDEPMMAVQLRSLARHSATSLLVGAPTLSDLERQGLRFFNSAILYAPDGEEQGRYSKMHLVPFGEYIPMEPALSFLRRFFEIGQFSRGREHKVFALSPADPQSARFAVLICYEDIFPGLVRQFVRGGAHFLVNITNDAWFGNTTAPYQHGQASIFRAVENRRYVIRAANTGWSCFISPSGRPLASVNDEGREVGVTGHAVLGIVPLADRTFYTRYGDVFLLLCGVVLVWAVRRRWVDERYARL